MSVFVALRACCQNWTKHIREYATKQTENCCQKLCKTLQELNKKLELGVQHRILHVSDRCTLSHAVTSTFQPQKFTHSSLSQNAPKLKFLVKIHSQHFSRYCVINVQTSRTNSQKTECLQLHWVATSTNRISCITSDYASTTTLAVLLNWTTFPGLLWGSKKEPLIQLVFYRLYLPTVLKLPMKNFNQV